VDVHVGRLRKALMQEGENDPVRTVRGAGYAFGADSRSVQSVAASKPG
jgi:two-component system phosphate regulon response regulator PhoB